jgi:hypothetical protein
MKSQNNEPQLDPEAEKLFKRVLWKLDCEWLADYDKKLCDDIKEYLDKCRGIE